MTELTRESYMESELTKWEERFVIPFEKEFMVKAVLDLQYQYSILPNDHVKAKADILQAIQRTLRDIDLKPRISNKQQKVLIVTDNPTQQSLLSELVKDLLGEKLLNAGYGSLQTKEYDIDIKLERSTVNSYRGRQVDYLINLTQDKEIHKQVKSPNII